MSRDKGSTRGVATESDASRKFADLMEKHLSKFPEPEQDRMINAGSGVVASHTDAP